MKKIAIIGTGIMGTGIAQCALISGFEVILVDINKENLEQAINNLNISLEDAAAKDIITFEYKDEALSRIKATTSYEEIDKDIDLAIEAVAEDLKTKIDLFRKLNQHCEPHVIFASNTSCILIETMAQHTGRPEKFIGTHFFFPAHKNKLLEIIPSKYTSPETTEEIINLANLIDKIAIKVKDSAGFCVNRFFVPLLNEATRLYEENDYDLYAINYAAKQAFKAPLGPFEIMNLTGTQLAYKAAFELSEVLGNFYRPTDTLEIEAETNAKWDLPESAEYKDLEAAALPETEEMIKRFQGMVMGIATHIVEGKIATPTDITIGAKIGLGWKKSPFDLINELGASEASNLVEDFARNYSDFSVSRLLEQKERWETTRIRQKRKGNIYHIQMMRPDALNALDENMFLDLEEAFETALEDQRIQIITLSGYPKVFSAGADIKFFINNLENEILQNIFDFTHVAHKVLNKISHSQKPVVALVDGIAYGGGLELALTCHFIAATKRSSIMLPETTLGIFPGFGGTQRLPKRTGVNIAKYLILTGTRLTAQEAVECNIIDRVIHNPVGITNFVNELSKSPIISKREIYKKFKQEHEMPEELIRTGKLMRSLDVLIEKRLISSRAKVIMKALESKPVNALKIANTLIDKSDTVSIEEGMKLEFGEVTEIFKDPELVNRFKQILYKK